MALPSLSSPFRVRELGITGAGRGRLPCVSSFRSWTSSRYLLAPLTASVVTVSCSGMSIGAGGAVALAAAVALALVLGAVAVKGCSMYGGASAAVGWAGAALAVTTGGTGGACIPFVVADLSAVAAAEAVAIMALVAMLFKTLEAAEEV